MIRIDSIIKAQRAGLALGAIFVRQRGQGGAFGDGLVSTGLRERYAPEVIVTGATLGFAGGSAARLPSTSSASANESCLSPS